MPTNHSFDVIIIGGSYSGLSAAMTLGRALRNTLIIDSGDPCNRQTPHSHNFITQDGKRPAAITKIARQQVRKYKAVKFLQGIARNAVERTGGFEIETVSGKIFPARKLIFATGIKDSLPEIPGLAECWGKSVLHCPYCHGYEVRQQKTGIVGNGDYAVDFSALISNWTNDLTVYTNGPSILTADQAAKLHKHGIDIVEDDFERLVHKKGYLQKVIFNNGSTSQVRALYTRTPFVQHCGIPAAIGCDINGDGYLTTDAMQRTSVHGIYACGDITTRLRTVANAVATGTTAGMMVNKELIDEDF